MKRNHCLYFLRKGKFSFSLLLLILFCISISAQNKQIDSLRNVLTMAKEDTGKVNTLNLLGRQFYLVNSYDSSVAYANRAQLLAEKLNFTKGIANACRGIGNANTDQGNFKTALEF